MTTAPRSLHRVQQTGACRLAALALLGTDAAVLVHIDVARALLGAGGARLTADLELRLRHWRVVLGLPGKHSARSRADVGAVEVQPDALSELGDAILGKAGVGARLTGLRARDARLDARRQGSRST
jgi:hypothetical protein